MKPSPCLSPIRVFNSSLRTYHYVPCGHCAACRCSKGFNLSERLGQSVARYAHKYFFTLTFDDNHLPIARYDSLTDSYLHPYDCDYNGVVKSVSRLVVDTSMSNVDFKKSFEKYNGVPCLSRRLLILFKKRLRKIFAKIYGKEYLFIYACGEYGSTTFRPHYHGILCTNAPIDASGLEVCVRKAWSDFDKARQEYVSEYGKIDFQRIVSRGAHNYVAQYLVGNTNLPLVYASGAFRPFYQSSPLISADGVRYHDTDLSRMFYRCSPKTDCVSLVDNTHTFEYYPKGIVNRVFPKCYKFSSLTFFDRVSLYSVYSKQPFTKANDFADCILDGFFGDNSVYNLYKDLFVDDDRYASKLRLVRHFYMSRRICRNASLLGVSVSDYVRQIDKFWSRYELSKLKDFYELQDALLNDKFNPCSLQDLFTLYYDTDDSIKNIMYYHAQFGFSDSSYSVFSIPSQCNYSSLMQKILLDTTKTKKRNGYFEAKGYRKPSFLSKFKTKKTCQAFFQI